MQKLAESRNSAWSSQVVTARKSNGKYRLRINFRKINRVTKKNALHLLTMTNIPNKL